MSDSAFWRALALASPLLAAAFSARAQSVNEFWLAEGLRGAPAVHETDPGYAALARRAGKPMQLSGAQYVRASWYGGGERLNRHTANGERFNPMAFTAAHRTLPMGARLVVEYRGRRVVVRINDRGPAKWTGRSLDLSRAAAAALGYLGAGVARVQIRVLG